MRAQKIVHRFQFFSLPGIVPADGAVSLILALGGDDYTGPCYGQIAGSSIAHGGCGTDAQTALFPPPGRLQKNNIEKAMQTAGVESSDITLFEAMGAGTDAGDVAEFHTIRETFCGGKSKVVVGLHSPAVGHAFGADGLIGLMKVLLSMHYGSSPGTPVARDIAPGFDFASLGCTLAPESQKLQKNKCGIVNSYGNGGAVAALVVKPSPWRKDVEEVGVADHIYFSRGG